MKATTRTVSLTSSPQIITLPDLCYPVTLKLASISSGRLIEVSPDGVDYVTPTVDYSTTGFIVVMLYDAPTSIRTSGLVSDVLSITETLGSR